MPKYRFTIIDVDNISDESVGVAESRNMAILIFRLTNSGYAVKDIRLATDSDMMIYNLKKFHSELLVKDKTDISSERYVIVRPVSHWFRNLLFVCVVVCLLCFLGWFVWR